MIRIADTLRALRGRRRWFAMFAAGATAALALPPVGAWPVLALSFPVLLLALDSLEPRRWRTALGLGWTFGFGYFLVAFHWIGFAFLVDAATYLWMMPFAVGALAASMAVYWGLAALAAHATGWRGLPLVLGFSAFLAVAENLRGRLFTGFPWAAPGLAVDGMGAVAQTASLIGMTGFTMLIVMWAGLPVALRRQPVLVTGLLLLLPLAYGFGAWRLASAGDAMVAGVRLRIVQPDIAQDEKWREDNARAIFDRLVGLSVAPSAAAPHGLADVTQVIWPESAVPFLIDESAVARQELLRMLGGRTALITGAIRRDPTASDGDGGPAVHNSVITFDGNAEVVGRYDKWRLVPGGEFLPFEWLLKPLGFRKVVTVPGSFQAGPGPVTQPVPGAPPAGMLICYEAIFPHDLVASDARPGWLVNVTNDGWFGASTGPYQHVAQARLRAIEQGLPLVRAANTGISIVIDSYGRTHGRLGLGERGVIDAPLPQAIDETTYARWGDVMLALLIALSLILAQLTSRGARNA
jgi:apolipoprotein N-acyltransferase